MPEQEQVRGMMTCWSVEKVVAALLREERREAFTEKREEMEATVEKGGVDLKMT